MNTIEQIVEKISNASHPGRSTTLVAIDGYGGAGKSTLATVLSYLVDCSSVVHCDHMLANPAHPEWRQRLLEQVVEPLLNNRAAKFAHFDWKTGGLVGWNRIEPGGVVIVEGVSSLHTDLGELWDVTIWVECPRELRLMRGVERDGEGMRATWFNEWMPAEDSYVLDEFPQNRADLVFDGSVTLE